MKIKDLPMFETLDQAVDAAAQYLPVGYTLDICIERGGYGAYLVHHNTAKNLALDGGDGIVSDIWAGIRKANGIDN